MATGQLLLRADRLRRRLKHALGCCLAGACELAVACDITIAAADAVFGEPELRFGSGIVTLILPWVVGPKRAKEILLTGNDRLSAAEALAIGLVNRVVPREDLEAEALRIARTIAVMDSGAVRLTKAAINRAASSTPCASVTDSRPRWLGGTRGSPGPAPPVDLEAPGNFSSGGGNDIYVCSD